MNLRRPRSTPRSRATAPIATAPATSSADLAVLQLKLEELELERQAVAGEHRALQEAHRAAERITQSYREFYDFAPIGVARLDASGVVQNINATGASMLGWDREHLLGKPLSMFIARGDRGRWRQHLKQIATTKIHKHVELTCPRRGAPLLFEFISTGVGFASRERFVTMFHDVTEARRADKEIRDAQAQMAMVADAAPVLISRCSRSLRYLFVNQACAEFLGRPREEIVGLPIAEVLGAEAFKSILPHIRKVLAGATTEYEMEITYPKAGRRFVRVAYQPERDSAGHVVGWLAAVTDITDRRQMEAALRESEMRFRQMADSAPVLIWVSGVDEQCTYFNKPWLRFTGRSLREELGMNWAQGVHPQDVDTCLPARQAAFEARKEFRMEYRLRRRDGRYRWFSDHGVPRFGSRGRFEGFIGSCVDITERRQAEDALRTAKDKLQARVRLRTAALTRSNTALAAEIREHKQAVQLVRRSEKNLDDFFVQSPLALFWVGIDGRIQRANRAALTLLERPADQCEGQLVSRFLVDSELGLDALARLARRQPLANFRARIRTRHGQIRHVLIDANGLWERGALKYSRWFVRDVTHRIELEREILATSERERQRLGQDLHDDLCQRLSAIEYLSQSLVGRLRSASPADGTRAAQIARMLRQSIEHTRSLARGLAPVQLDTGGLTTALRELAARTKKIFHVRCHLKAHASVHVPDPNVGMHLYRIAQEGVSNAIKHGRARRIDIVLQRLQQNVMLAVRDNGIGIPVRLRSRKGMGLRVMQYRAGLIEGTLVVQRQPNGGTSVVCMVRGGAGKTPE